MTVLVIGSTPTNARRIGSLASMRRVRVRFNRVFRRPDWILAANASQRAEAVSRYRLPAFRVVLVPSLGTDGALDVEAIEEGLTRMAELGVHRLSRSTIGVAVTSRLMSRIMARLERLVSDEERYEAERRAAAQLTREAERRSLRSRASSPATVAAAPQAGIGQKLAPDDAIAVVTGTPQRAEKVDKAQRAAEKAIRRAAKLALMASPRGPNVDADARRASEVDENVTERVERFASRALRWNVPSGT